MTNPSIREIDTAQLMPAIKRLPAKSMSWKPGWEGKFASATFSFNGVRGGSIEYNSTYRSWDAELTVVLGDEEISARVAGLPDRNTAARTLVKQWFELAEHKGWIAW